MPIVKTQQEAVDDYAFALIVLQLRVSLEGVLPNSMHKGRNVFFPLLADALKRAQVRGCHVRFFKDFDQFLPELQITEV